VDGVLVCVAPTQAAQVVRDAAAAGLKNVWLQMGAESPEAAQAAKEVGLTPVTGKCLLMYLQPVKSFHSWHRGFAKLFGQL
jgi:predicted CoA-binding protein